MNEAVPRLDWLLRAAGLIRSARVYSAFVIENHLYLIDVGRGWARLGVTDGAYAGMADRIAKAQQAKVRVNLDILNGVNVREEIPARAEFAYPLSAIAQVDVQAVRSTGLAWIRLKAKGKGPARLTLQNFDHLAGAGARDAFLSALPNVSINQLD